MKKILIIGGLAILVTGTTAVLTHPHPELNNTTTGQCISGDGRVFNCNYQGIVPLSSKGYTVPMTSEVNNSTTPSSNNPVNPTTPSVAPADVSASSEPSVAAESPATPTPSPSPYVPPKPYSPSAGIVIEQTP